MKQWRTSTAFKALCGLLCCLFFAGAVSTAAYEVWNWSKIDGFNPQYDRELYGKDVVAGSNAVGNYRQAAVRGWYYKQVKNPNAEEQRRAQEYAKTLNPGSTNFRYRIYDLNGILLDSNTDAGQTMEELCGESYLVGVNEQDGILVYETDEILPSENHDLNELLSSYYYYDEKTQSYYAGFGDADYQEKYENWRTHCNDIAAMEERKQELTAEQETEGVAFEEERTHHFGAAPEYPLR